MDKKDENLKKLLFHVWEEGYEAKRLQNPLFMESFAHFQEKQINELEKSMGDYFDIVNRGVDAFLNVEDPEIKSLFSRFSEISQQLVAVDEAGLSELEKKKNSTYQTIFGVSNQNYLRLYTCALNELNAKNGEVATAMFSFLIWLNPYAYFPVMGLGLCASQMGDYEKAKKFFNISLSLDNKDAELCLYAAENLLALKEEGEAKELILQAIECAKENQDQDSLKNALDIQARMAR